MSQDGPNAQVTEVVRRHGAHSLVHPRRNIQLQRGTYLFKMPGYAYLSVGAISRMHPQLPLMISRACIPMGHG